MPVTLCRIVLDLLWNLSKLSSILEFSHQIEYDMTGESQLLPVLFLFETLYCLKNNNHFSNPFALPLSCLYMFSYLYLAEVFVPIYCNFLRLAFHCMF